tara:strand:+ start:532 stop:1017 length:486 start_codon:yes stop_codon:yes gene_type:complete
MFLKYFNIKKNNHKNQTLSIYQEIVNHSNHFIKNSLNDRHYNFNEIFEIFTIVIIFYLKKLKDKNNQESKEISQIIIDSFINDLDQHFREQGIGDMSIGKYVKKYVKKFYYRLKILDNVLEQNEEIKFNNYLVKFGIINFGDYNKLNQDLNYLYNELLIGK